MTYARILPLAVVGFVAVLAGPACGSDSSGGGPVASSPLRGTVGGTDFVAMSARANKSATSPDLKKTLDIFDAPVACGGAPPAGPPREIVLSVPWTPGYAADFSFGGSGQLGSFLIEKNGMETISITATGRIEVLEAPSEKGSKGRVRLRMSGDDGAVEGEIAVDVCE
jgi:hypothetical protein